MQLFPRRPVELKGAWIVEARMPVVSPFELIRPLAWLAVLAFLLGFGGYLSLAAGEAAKMARLQAAAPASEPLMADQVSAVRL